MKTYVFDIDGTICTKANDQNYDQSIPVMERVMIINRLFDAGNIIVLHTARGMGRHKNNISKAKKQFHKLTLKQLNTWGVKYHELFMGKPSGDFYIDDKGISDEDFFGD